MDSRNMGGRGREWIIGACMGGRKWLVRAWEVGVDSGSMGGREGGRE